MSKVTISLIVVFSLFGGWIMGHQVKAALGAFGDPFISLQLATDPDNGECLTTDGTNNSWGTGCGGLGSATSTEPLMASWFVATSTTATSTFAHNLVINTAPIGVSFSTGLFFGSSTRSTGLNSVAIGKGARALNTNSFALGADSYSDGAASIAIGQNADAEGPSTVAIGQDATAISVTGGGFAMGTGATANGVDAIAFGNVSTANGLQSICIGYGCDTNDAENGIAIGAGAIIGTNPYTSSIAIGEAASAYCNSCISLGATTESDFDNMFSMGSNTNPINQMWIYPSATPTKLGFADGNIGIGTTSPYAKLSVVGEVVGAYFNATTTSTSTLPRLSSTGVSTDWLCITGDCRSAWPIAGSSFGQAWEIDANGFLAPTSTQAIAVKSSATSTFSAGLEAPTIGASYLNATSTTATSTFAGGLLIGANIRFPEGITRTIIISDKTVQGTGDGLGIKAGSAIANTSLTTAQRGGLINIITGNGANNFIVVGSQTAGAGGNLTLTTGTGGSAHGGTSSAIGGVGGSLFYVGGAGGNSNYGKGTTNTGGVGGGLSFAGGVGGVTMTTSTIARSGAGGGMTFTAGAGGAATTTNVTPGNGGALSFVSGAGGAVSWNGGTGGTAGGVVLTGGNGGASSGSGVATNTGGVGASYTLTAGAGGAASGGVWNISGAGGSLRLQAGSAGSTGDAQGAGGNATIVGGAANLGSGTPGIPGNVYLLGGDASYPATFGSVVLGCGIPVNRVVCRGRTGVATTSPISLFTISATSSLSNFSLFSIWAEKTLNATSSVLLVDSNGKVGIGTSSPSTQFALNASANTMGFYIAGYNDTTADLFRVSTSSASATSTAFVIDSNGKVGIGTTSPYLDFTVQGYTAFDGLYKSKGFTVATLPPCNLAGQGYRAHVTDALAPAFLTTVVGGGAVVSPVFCDGTNWVAH